MPNTASPSPLPEPRTSLQQAVLFAVLSAVLFLACLICAWGFVSLVSSTDVVAEPVGPLVAAVIPGTATVLVFIAVLLRLRDRRSRLLWIPAILAALAVYLVPALLAACVLAFDRVDLVSGLLFFAQRLMGPYVPTAALLAGAVVLVTPLVRRMPPPRDRRTDSDDGGSV